MRREGIRLDGAPPLYPPKMVPEAPFEETESGVVPVGNGWFVLNAREARWNQRPGRAGLTFTGSTDFEADMYDTVDETVRRYGASPEEDTQDGDVAYSNVPESEPTRYRDDRLPG
jgi:hypothetical protein